MADIILVSSIIVVAFVLFASEKLRVDLVAILIMATLMLIGLFRSDFPTPKESISGFSNTATATIAAMFVLSGGLVKTGAINLLTRKIIRLGRGNPYLLFIVLMTTVGIVSAFINNAAAVAVFIPITLTICKQYKISPSQMLIPLSFASVVGGTCTLIGTSTNILVSSMSGDHGIGEFAMFELSKLGGVFFLVGMIYLFVVARRVLPHREGAGDLTIKYRVADYVTGLIIGRKSSLIGRTPAQCMISSKYDVTILSIIRGDRQVWAGIKNTTLEEGDLLLSKGTFDGFMQMQEHEGVSIRAQDKFADRDLASDKRTVVEAIVSPNSSLVGNSLIGADFRRKHGVFALAIRKHAETIHEKIGLIKLEVGDTLLLQGRRDFLEQLATSPDFLMLQEIAVPTIQKGRAIYSMLIMALVVGAAASGIAPILVAAILGGVLMILTRCLTIKDAYDSIDWFVIFLLAGVIPLGVVMERTGTAEFIAHQFLTVSESLGPIAIIGAFYLLTTIFASIMSHNAAAIVLVPIGIASAHELGVSPIPLLMTITFAASSSVSTPFGYHTNLMVYAAGGYKFSDYIKVGLPMNIIFWILATLLIPIIWPLSP